MKVHHFVPLILLLTAAAAAAEAPLVLRPCNVPDVEETLRCGDLLVPENPARPQGRQIKLYFVIVPATAPVTGRAPLFDLAGGPGLAATASAAFYATAGSAHRRDRDVVLVDQRGTGESSPLRCPELEQLGALERMYPPDAVRRCRKTLARHADLSQYTTANTVADLEAVRAVLGYDKIDLFGLSYGSRVVLAYIDRFPQRVRAALIMGAVPQDAKVPLWHARNAQEALEGLFDDCAADASCRSRYPALRERWSNVLRNPAFDGPAREAFRNLLGTADSQRSLPRLIDSIGTGDLRPFTDRVSASTSGAFAEGLYLSIACAEDTQAIEPDEIREATTGTFLGRYRVEEQSAACREWNVPQVELTYGSGLRARPPREVPLLAVAGDRDAVTPVRWAERIVARFPRGRLVVIPKLAHVPIGLDHFECLDSMIALFYREADAAAVDTSCITKMTPPPFD